MGETVATRVGQFFEQTFSAQFGGKEYEAPGHHKLEAFVDEYIKVAGIASDKEGPLFRTTGRSTGTPHRMTPNSESSISLGKKETEPPRTS